VRKITEELLIKSPSIAAFFYGLSLMGLMICFFSYNFGGMILYPLFYVLNAWPLLVLQQIDGVFHSNILGIDENYSNAFGRGQFISIAGWLLISPFVLMIYRGIKMIQSKNNKES
jgi:hypothetical protein